MFKKMLAHPTVHLAVFSLVLFGVLISVIPEAIPQLSWLVNHAEHLMLLYLFAGILMLFFREPKLTFIFFGGCLLLCFFLKYSMKDDGFERWRRQVVQQDAKEGNSTKTVISDLKIAHVNLTNANSREEVASILKETKADIISFHEVTLGWERWLIDSFGMAKPHHHIMLDLGIYGMSVFSKYPLIEVDTFFYNEIPNLRARIEKDGRYFNLVCVHTLPALDDFSKKRLKKHLETVGDELNKKDEPTLVVGDFNAVSWSGQIRSFMDKSSLIDSRKGFMPNTFKGNFSWGVPLDHIFYSGDFRCSDFQNIDGEDGQHLGILGTYHYAVKNHAKKEN